MISKNYRLLSSERRVKRVRRKAPSIPVKAIGLVFTVFGLLAVSTLGASGAITPRAAQPHRTETPLTIQYTQGNTTAFAAFAAYREGFFYRNGIDASLINISGSSNDLAALEGGSVNLINVTPENAVIAASKGFNIEAVSSAVNSDGFFQMIANNTVKDVGGSNLTKKLQALKGDTLGVSGLGSSVMYATEALMSTAGLQYPADYSFAVVLSGAPYYAAMITNKIQGGLVPAPTGALLTANKTGFILDSLLTPTYTQPKQMTSGQPYGDTFGLDSWVATHKQVVKDLQKAYAQTYVWEHNPNNFAKVEALVLDAYGATQVPNGQLKSLTQNTIIAACAWISKSALALTETFDRAYGFIPSIVPLKSLVVNYGPTNEAQAIALAKS